MLVEIVGFWRPEYLRKKFALLRKSGRKDLVLAVSERLNLEAAGVDLGEWRDEVVWFKGKLDPKAVLERVEIGGGEVGRERRINHEGPGGHEDRRGEGSKRRYHRGTESAEAGRETGRVAGSEVQGGGEGSLRRTQPNCHQGEAGVSEIWAEVDDEEGDEQHQRRDDPERVDGVGATGTGGATGAAGGFGQTPGG